MGEPAAKRPRGDALLLRHLAALDRMTGQEGGCARRQLESELGRELTRLLVSMLRSRRRIVARAVG
jgi:hypothetical protein